MDALCYENHAVSKRRTHEAENEIFENLSVDVIINLNNPAILHNVRASDHLNLGLVTCFPGSISRPEVRSIYLRRFLSERYLFDWSSPNFEVFLAEKG